MKLSRITALALVLAAVLFCSPAGAQDVCGGITGIQCKGDRFCQFADGECCCDFFGVCVEKPETCPAVCDPVCGCNGETYDNRCVASAAGASVAHSGPCDPIDTEVSLSGFNSLQRLIWDPMPEAQAYNVYLHDELFAAPGFYGDCLYGAVPENSVLLQGNPDPGRLWMIQVAALLAEGVGPLGSGEGCQPRTLIAPCTCTAPSEEGPCGAAFQRWFHDYATGQCEPFLWGGCRGNANRFESLDDCDAECRNACEQPAVQGDCEAAIPRWYHNALTGHCDEFIWGGCGGNENNFTTEAECLAACGDICFLPAEFGDCDGVCYGWAYFAETAQCEQFFYGCCAANANNFPSQAECEAECAAFIGGESSPGKHSP